jgi:hypothetical protein
MWTQGGVGLGIAKNSAIFLEIRRVGNATAKDVIGDP